MSLPPLLSRLCVVLTLAVLLLGCNTQQPELVFRSADGSGRLDQKFAVAAMSQDTLGNYDLVLVSQGFEKKQSVWRRAASAANPVGWFRSEPAGQPLSPAAQPPVRQVLSMKIHWRPTSGAEPENPAASNATVRWNVFGDAEPGAKSEDVVEYQGTAFVRIFFKNGGYDLLVQAGQLKLTRLEGEMSDPLGPTRFNGRFWVPDDAFLVSGVLQDLPPPAEVAVPQRQAIPSVARRPATRPAR